MAENKQPKTCEEYVLNQLARLQHDLDYEKEVNERLHGELKGMAEHYNELLLKLLPIIACVTEREENFNHVYLYGSYIGLYDAKDPNIKGQELLMKKLIELAQYLGVDVHRDFDKDNAPSFEEKKEK